MYVPQSKADVIDQLSPEEDAVAQVELAGRGSVAYQWNGEGRETVVLVNGSVFNFHQWDRQPLPILTQELGGRYRFLQYDYVGVGGSSRKLAPFNMFDLADELRDLLDALAVDRVHLCGISKGSLVGQAFLICHRDRAISFCGLGNPCLLSEAWEPTFRAFQERIRELETLRELWPQRISKKNYARVFKGVYVPALFGKESHELSLLDRVRAVFARRLVYPALEGTYIQTMVDLFRYYVDGIEREAPAYRAGLPEVKGVPILLLNGTADETTPVEMSRELAEWLLAAELIEFDGVTHMGPMMHRKQAQPVFTRYGAFLRDLARATE
jgi:pimeloyl-ACP methyl ester carboxylesterase